MKIADALVRLTHLVQHEFADGSRRNGITPQQAQLLCLLIDGRVRMTQLSRLLHLEKSSLTGLVDRTAQRGLVERVADSSDRRACQIRLTRQGRQVANKVHDEIAGRLEQLARSLPLSERSQLGASVGQLLDAAAFPKTVE